MYGGVGCAPATITSLTLKLYDLTCILPRGDTWACVGFKLCPFAVLRFVKELQCETKDYTYSLNPLHHQLRSDGVERSLGRTTEYGLMVQVTRVNVNHLRPFAKQVINMAHFFPDPLTQEQASKRCYR